MLGFSYAIGQTIEIGFLYLNTFSYSDFLIYSLYSIISIILGYILWGMFGFIILFPFRQVKEIYYALRSSKYKNAFSETLLLLTLFFFILFIMTFSESVQFKYSKTISVVLMLVNSLIYFLLTRKNRKKNKFEETMDSNTDFFIAHMFKLEGFFIFLLAIIFISSVYTSIQRERGDIVVVSYQNTEANLKARLIASNSNTLVLSKNGNTVFVPRDKIFSLTHCEKTEDIKDKTNHLKTCG